MFVNVIVKYYRGMPVDEAKLAEMLVAIQLARTFSGQWAKYAGIDSLYYWQSKNRGISLVKTPTRKMIKEKNFPPARSTESGFLQVKNAKFTPSKFDIKIEKLSHKDHKVHGEILMNGRI